jgi:hypothetical protein
MNNTFEVKDVDVLGTIVDDLMSNQMVNDA